jgi:DNA helicase-2/ATP-dependent DNA helicase PcrA
MHPSPVHLDEDQLKAVQAPMGPLLILAGAGSGKTRVLTERIVYLIRSVGLLPHRICALTFTHKAAKEMQTRILGALSRAGSGVPDRSLSITTFHSLALKLVKEFHSELGYQSNVSIYDTLDQVHLLKDICHRKGWDTDRMDVKGLVSQFSSVKESQFVGLDPDKLENGELFVAYQQALKEHNAVDFADMLVLLYQLLNHPDHGSEIQKRWDYVLVDEFQDTNAIQFAILKRLTQSHGNVFVVGDEDQSIYKFRGAVIENILGFDSRFSGVKVIPLRFNYRSTRSIVGAAQFLINHNQTRKHAKAMIPMLSQGEPVGVLEHPTDRDEASYIVRAICDEALRGGNLSEVAVFYRTHSLSRLFEDMLRKFAIPYRVFGSLRFYERAEIKDMLAYCKCVINPSDGVALKRILNVPPRGVGKASLHKLEQAAESRGQTFAHLLFGEADLTGLGISPKAIAGIESFRRLIQTLRAALHLPLEEWFELFLEESKYGDFLSSQPSPDAAFRVENVKEFKQALIDFKASVDTPSLSGFLEALHLDQDVLTEASGMQPQKYVSLMTCHAAKGLEFSRVYVVGCEEGYFPLIHDVHGMFTSEQLEEERRLFYVAMTRAKEHLVLSCVHLRKRYGMDQPQFPSRFLRELPREGVRWINLASDLSRRDPIPRGFSRLGSFPGQSPSSSSPPLEMRYEYEPEEREPLSGPKVGEWIQHPSFGKGQVLEIESSSSGRRLKIRFVQAGIKRIAASFLEPSF